jgi:NADH-quinone oxidoreductase subunit H
MKALSFLRDFLYHADTLVPALYSQARVNWVAAGLPGVALDILFQLSIAVMVAVFIALNALFIIWLERKVAAKLQVRLGPNRVGPFGIFQTLADTVKLLIKEDIVPTKADRPVFTLAPLIVFTGTFLVFLVVPFSKGMIAADLNVGLLFVVAVTGLAVLGILSAGWSSNNKYSLIGALRSAAQIVSYEIPAVLTILSVAMLAGSLQMTDIIKAQPPLGYVLFQPVGFILFLIAATAENNRSPFDLPEGESELVSGFLTEYSGMRFALFFLAEYTNVFVTAALATTLFLGGWRGPFLPPVVWFFLKTYAVVMFLIWVRWTFPRIRDDQLMSFCWKVLAPLALLNLVITAVVVRILSPGGS